MSVAIVPARLHPGVAGIKPAIEKLRVAALLESDGYMIVAAGNRGGMKIISALDVLQLRIL